MSADHSCATLSAVEQTFFFENRNRSQSPTPTQQQMQQHDLLHTPFVSMEAESKKKETKNIEAGS